MRADGQSHPGRIRHANQDCLGVDTGIGLLVIADGMGGHNGGEVASALAVNTVTSFLRQNSPTEKSPESLVEESVRRADQAISTRATQEASLKGMGATLVLALCFESDILLAHVGDSRAYILRKGVLQRLTEDHSLVAQMVRKGEISASQATRHHLRHVVTRSLGTGDHLEPEIQRVIWDPGDYLVLCSDGLSSMVKEERIRSLVLNGGEDLGRICRKLVEVANKNGGKDNISVVLAIHD